MPTIGKVKELIRTVVLNSPKVSIGLWGPPGVGKSSIIQQIAKELKMKFVDIRLAQFEPSEIRGIPYMKDGVSKWARADFLPTSNDPTILMFDEFSCAEPSVQN